VTRKPTTKSPDERRLRKQLREVLQVYAADTSKFNTDATIRELLSLIDDEVRRTRMSIAPAVCWNPNDWLGHEPQHVKLDGVTTVRRDMLPSMLTCGGK
jgi:hypothetical protein